MTDGDHRARPVPPARPRRDHLREWSADIARGLDAVIVSDPEVIARTNAAGAAIREYFERLVAERRRAPRADILSGLIAAEEAGDRLSTDELFATVILLFL